MIATPDETVSLLWRDLHARVEAFVRRRLPPGADAEDVVQDVFLRLHVRLVDGARIDDPEALIFRIARNAVIDAVRRRRASQPGGDPADEDLPEEAAPDDSVRTELAGCVTPFVDRLPEPYREALRLTELGGLTQAEAAARLGVSPSGMRTRVQRGRQRLRDLFDACCHFEVDRRGGVIAYEGRCCGARC